MQIHFSCFFEKLIIVAYRLILYSAAVTYINDQNCEINSN